MGSANFIEGLKQIKGLSKTTERFLESSGTDLERLANKAIKNGDRLTPTEQDQFRNIYSEYLTRSMSDRRAAVNLGVADAAKAQEEIRSDFFNKALGHIGKTDEDRIALRAALARKAFEPKGETIILSDGTRVQRADYDALKALKKSGIDLGADEAKWKMIQEAEKKADEAAKVRASANHASDKTAAEGVESSRKAAAEKAAASKTPPEFLAKQKALVMEIESSTRQDSGILNIGSTLIGAGLRKVGIGAPQPLQTTNGAVGAAEVLEKLRAHVLTPEYASLELKKGRLSPKETLEALSDGYKVEDTSMRLLHKTVASGKLEKHFIRNLITGTALGTAILAQPFVDVIPGDFDESIDRGPAQMILVGKYGAAMLSNNYKKELIKDYETGADDGAINTILHKKFAKIESEKQKADAELGTQNKETIEKNIAANAQTNALEMRKRSAGLIPNAAPTSEENTRSGEMAALFNTLTTTDKYGVKGKERELESAYIEATPNGALDKKILEAKLKDQQVPARTIETIMDFAIR